MKQILTFILFFISNSLFSADLIVNGNFDTPNTGWTTTGNFYFNSNHSHYKSSPAYAWFANSDGTWGNNIYGTIFQSVSIPSNATSITFSFWTYIASNESLSATTAYDKLTAEVYSSATNKFAKVFSNLDVSSGYVYRSYSLNVSNFKGKTVIVKFIGDNDGSLSTVFRIDDVKLDVSTSSGGGSSLATRSGVAEKIYKELFGNSSNPANHTAYDYPTNFIDLQSNNNTNGYCRILSFLEYGDGTPVFYRNSNYFNKYSNEYRGNVVRQCLEAWDIAPATSGNTTYNDVYAYDPNYFYIVKASQLGLIPNTTNFYPFSYATNSFVDDLIDDLDFYYPVSTSTLNNSTNYFIPNNFNPFNIGVTRGLEQGVFNHYAKNSFNIPDKGIDLNFSHFYSTELVELPDEHLIKPFGRGWSHTYNCYIVEKEINVGGSSSDMYFNIVWPDGSVHIYNEDENEYETIGVYDELEKTSSTKITITKKDQTKYYFKKYETTIPRYYLYKIDDRNENTFRFYYEKSAINTDSRRLESVKSASGMRLFFHYKNSYDYLDSITDEIDRVIKFELDDIDRLKYFYDAKGQETRYYYVANDDDVTAQHNYEQYLLRKVRLPRGNTIKAEYDNQTNGKLKKVTTDDNVIEILQSYNFNTDTPIVSTIKTKNSSNNTINSTYKFNKNGILTHFENDIDELDITYPINSSSTTPLLPTTANFNGLDIEYDWDNKGNLEKIDVENGDYVEEYEYNSDNTVKWHKDANGNKTYFYYDSNGNLKQIKEPISGSNIYFYPDEDGQDTLIVNQEGIKVRYRYDNGVVDRITAPMGMEARFYYDDVNRQYRKKVNGLSSYTSFDANDNLISYTNTGGYITTYDYDANDNVKTITNARGVPTSIEYNDEDQPIKVKFGTPDSLLITEYEYYENGMLEKIIKPSGDECIAILELQKSSFANSFYFNIKIFIQGIFNKKYSPNKDLIKSSMGHITNQIRDKDVFDFDTPMDDDNRKHELIELFDVFINPFTDKALSRKGLLELEAQEKIFLLPAVKAELV